MTKKSFGKSCSLILQFLWQSCVSTFNFQLQWYPVSMGKNVSAASPRLLSDTFPYSKTVADTSTMLDGLRSGISYEVVVRAKNTAGDR